MLPTGLGSHWAQGGQAPAKIRSNTQKGEPLPRLNERDEGEVASSLPDWLKDRRSLPDKTATEVAEKLAETWWTGAVKVDQAPPIVLEPPGARSESQEESASPGPDKAYCAGPGTP